LQSCSHLPLLFDIRIYEHTPTTNMRGFTTIAITLAAACFASAASLESSHAANVKAGLRLLDLEDGAEPVWKTEAEKLELMRAFVDFVSISLHQT
jgi:leucyl aminopeptidase